MAYQVTYYSIVLTNRPSNIFVLKPSSEIQYTSIQSSQRKLQTHLNSCLNIEMTWHVPKIISLLKYSNSIGECNSRYQKCVLFQVLLYGLLAINFSDMRYHETSCKR